MARTKIDLSRGGGGCRLRRYGVPGEIFTVGHMCAGQRVTRDIYASVTHYTYVYLPVGVRLSVCSKEGRRRHDDNNINYFRRRRRFAPSGNRVQAYRANGSERHTHHHTARALYNGCALKRVAGEGWGGGVRGGGVRGVGESGSHAIAPICQKIYNLTGRA